MPIHCPVSIRCLDADEFEALDYRVMGHTYASQNDLGRLCDESVYQADLRARLLADGFASVHSELPVTVIHRDFSNNYYLDLVADDALYELKADKALSTEHDTQLLNYIFLLGLRRGKLLNFRPSRVHGKIVATSLSPEERRRVIPITERWRNLTPACETLQRTMCELLLDWGAFLDTALYQEALVHFFGGADKVEQRVLLARSGVALGAQRLLLHAPGITFRLTALKESQELLESHLERLLALTGLRAFQWINLNHTQIEFTTVMLNPTRRVPGN
jgi:GxxExxY protein